ncbi:hypothetical protein B7P43_G01090 [Cryptotermes secundus]|uniref:Ubiquitin carboxyl-terminal hydrolase 36 n=1 Tax=Cryptotermes secundus TaxID=105785 RepID=A0A2J7PTH6_9NEOP|nr:hypothetical protein B7P43_G01090 [Cryptotermes secundus]
MAPEPESMLPTPKITFFPAHGIQLGWRKNDCVGGGMINVDNSCYLNSTLQALFHVPAFVNWLCSDNSHLSNCTVVNGSVKDVYIICAMNKTFKASRKKSGTIIKPLLIYSRLQFISKDLVPGQQEDAHEFMCYLLKSAITRLEFVGTELCDALNTVKSIENELNRTRGEISDRIKTEIETVLHWNAGYSTLCKIADILSGHKNPGPSHFYEFDDSLVQAILLSVVLGTDAYIMMYECEPEGPSMPQKSVLSAAATTATCAVNGQKTSSYPQAPVSHKNGSVVKHRQGCGSNSALYTCASSPPSAKGELTSSDSVAAPHCSRDKPSLGEVSPPFQHSSLKCKRPFAHKSCCPDSDVTVNDMKLLEDYSKLLKSHTGNETDVESGGDNMTRRGEHVKKIKDNNEGIQTILSQPESKHIRVSDVETLNSVQDSWIEEKKRNKKHKKKRTQKSTADVSEGSKAAEGICEWVEETSKTLGTNIAYQAQINVHCWTGTHKPGEQCDMNEGLENDASHKKFNRRKHKVKHHHLCS